jgi:Glycosyl transferases group 1.
MRVIVDPSCNIPYCSYYLEGLNNLFGLKVGFSSGPFEGLSSLGKDLRFVVTGGGTERKYFIHADDSYKIRLNMYDWCDVYGSVNANYTHYPKESFGKLVSLVPSFAIRNYSLFGTVLHSLLNYSRAHRVVASWTAYNRVLQREECVPKKNVRRFFLNYLKNYLYRCSLDTYLVGEEAENDYVFFLSTLWYNDEWNKNNEGVNLRRAHFIRACKSLPSLRFEGGLLGDDALFSDCLAHERMAMKEWMERTKRSAVVFNTPAFWDCHGWKLGEYLALGKAIVSTTLSNDLPAPLVHGENIHFVENSEEAMREAVEYIVTHPDYRKKLEQGARSYWEKYGTPEKSLELLFAH